MIIQYFQSRDISNINSCVLGLAKNPGFDLKFFIYLLHFRWNISWTKFVQVKNPYGILFQNTAQLLTVYIVSSIGMLKGLNRQIEHSRSKVFIDRIVMFYRTVSVGDYPMSHPWDHPWRLNPGLYWTWTKVILIPFNHFPPSFWQRKNCNQGFPDTCRWDIWSTVKYALMCKVLHSNWWSPIKSTAEILQEFRCASSRRTQIYAMSN